MIAALRRSLRPLRCFAAFAAAFIAVCAAIHRTLPLQDVPTVWEKLTHLAAHGSDYDTLFIGSSRIYYQIIPRLFDELSATQGLPTRSFNAGVAGMRPPEDAFLFDQILAQRPGRLRWVFVELAGIRANIGDERRGTLRMQYWHDLTRTALLWRYATQLPETNKRWTPKRLWQQWRDPLAQFLPHFALFLREQTNIGKGVILTRRLGADEPPPPDPLSVTLGSDLAGWIPINSNGEMPPKNRTEFEQELAERRERPSIKDYGDPVSQEALGALIAKIRRAGATPVLIVPPTTSKKNFFPMPAVEEKTLVLDFSDITRFPELYEIRHRLDTEHTNTTGSEVFTRLIVQSWAQAVKPPGNDAPRRAP
jgi:hypothetical protein